MLMIFCTMSSSRRRKLTRAALATSILIALVFVLAAAPNPAADPRHQHQVLRGQFAADAGKLADRCMQAGQAELADEIRRFLVERPDDGLSFRAVAMAGDPCRPATTESPATDDARAEFDKLRQQYAKRLYELAVTTFRDGQITLSYDLVREVVQLDPDHGPARSLLGYSKRSDRWVTPYAAHKLASNQIWDARFGWIAKGNLERYEAGTQLWKGQWLPADEVARYRSAWSNAWEVETEHYLVRTNVSLERGVELAEHLEQLYSIFFRLFAGYFTPRDQIAALFDRRSGLGKMAEPKKRRGNERFRVHFYRERDEYLAALKPYVRSGLDVSTGMYVPKSRTCYFFANPRQRRSADLATVVHEGTHQLFVETRPQLNLAATEGNYWVIEGMSCYMETLTRRGNQLELGLWNTARLASGRRRIVDQKQYVPLDGLVRMKVQDFDGQSIHGLYTQSACVCHFFMHHDGGRFRDALVEYLEAVYTGQADANTLSALTGLPYAKLDDLILQHVTNGAR
jgi:hypothetical protein